MQFSLVQFLIAIANASTYKSLPPFPAYYCSINSCIHLQMSSFTNHICKARLLKMWLALQDSSCTKAQTQTHIYDVRTSVTTQGSQPAGRCLWFDRLFVFSHCHKPQLRFSAHPGGVDGTRLMEINHIECFTVELVQVFTETPLWY